MTSPTTLPSPRDAQRDSRAAPTRWHRLGAAIALLFLAPVMAEYLLGYDSSTGNPAELLGNLILFAPLYGAPALLLREMARRTGRGWPTILLLSLAFGLAQAGLIDHSLFNASYRDIEYWDLFFSPTLVPSVGVSLYALFAFVSGHMIWSFSAPIAIVEALVPSVARSPWVGKAGLVVLTLLYIAAAALVFDWHLTEEQFLPSPLQLGMTALVVIALIVAAFVVRLPPGSPDERNRMAPTPWIVGIVAFLCLSLTEGLGALLGEFALVSATFTVDWRGLTLSVALLLVLGVALYRWSQRRGWGALHRLAAAAGAVLTHLWMSFLGQPIGDVPLLNKLLHNVGFTLGSIVLLYLAARHASASEQQP